MNRKLNVMYEKKVIEYSHCRLCGSKELDKVFSLGNQYINDFVEESEIGKGIKSPLETKIS